MKTQYDKVFAAHVQAKIMKAKELGISASWTTANHLDALAAAIAEAIGEDSDATKVIGCIRDVLGECYNVSAFQQMLAKKFEKAGHFQRQKDRPIAEKADDVYAQLARDLEAKSAQG